jgi:galactokinase
MDQFASVHGRKNQFMILDCDSLDFRYVDAATPDCCWVLVNSMVSHQLGDQYNEIRRDLESAMQKMGTESFLSLTVADVEATKGDLSAREYSRSRYAVGELLRTPQFVAALSVGEVAEAGQLLQETHRGLSQDLGVSTPELDALIDAATSVEGWYGGRMMGGGFGGCTLNLVANSAICRFRETVGADFRKRFDLIPDFYDVSIGSGACCATLPLAVFRA